MGPEIQTQRGECPTHGVVEATREMPRIQFPFFVYAVLRARAKRRPFLCPECDAPVKTG